MKYVAKLGQFLFYMRHGAKPQGVLERDWQLYRRVVEKLVEKGQFKPEALNDFASPET